ncbi:hypothetical protein SAMN04488142_0041 [Halomonas sp. hl-4]|nr:hypothetical protein SAMN04488142_0041 [Halomonas sp. hl-4]
MTWQLFAGIGIGIVVTLVAQAVLFYWASKGDSGR